MVDIRANKNSRIFQYLASFSGGFGLVSYGINTSWTSPFLPQLTSNSSAIPMTIEEGSWLAMSPLLGCPLGAIGAIFIADKFGRKRSILSMAPIVFICCIIIALTTNIWSLHAMRFIIGVTDGVCFTIVPMYIGEISSAQIRGFLSSLSSLYFTFGTLFINFIGSFWDFKTCAYISAAIPALHFLTFMFMPESPYWYLKVRKYEKAKKSLKTFRCTSNIESMFETIKTAVEEDSVASKSSFSDLFAVPSNRRACLICFLISCQNRATAKMPFTFYTVSIFEQTGSTLDPSMSSIICCFVELVIVALSAYFIYDRFGRKKLITISVIGCIVTLLATGLYFVLKDANSFLLKYLNWLPLTALVIYIIFNSAGIAFAPFCYASELFPTSVKASGVTFLEITHVITAILSGKVFQATGDYFGTLSVPFIGFSLLTLVVLIFVIKIVPETKEKTLEEIQLLLKKKSVGKSIIKT